MKNLTGFASKSWGNNRLIRPLIAWRTSQVSPVSRGEKSGNSPAVCRKNLWNLTIDRWKIISENSTINWKKINSTSFKNQSQGKKPQILSVGRNKYREISQSVVEKYCKNRHSVVRKKSRISPNRSPEKKCDFFFQWVAFKVLELCHTVAGKNREIWKSIVRKTH